LALHFLKEAFMKALQNSRFRILCVLLVLSGLALGIAGCDGGAAEFAAVDATAADAGAAVATDAAATAATDTAATGAADAAGEVITETAIAGSSDVLLTVGNETIEAEPFVVAVDAGDSASDLVSGWTMEVPNGTTLAELNDKATGQLQMLAVTTRAIYEVHRLYLDVQRSRVIMEATVHKGDLPTWGQFPISDRLLKDLETTKKLDFTGTSGTSQILAASSD
jgi:hypothetical protein